ncbi:MAG: aminodeoxychorismate/anthranilate synthase component II [Polyangiaceae bacterium]
MNVLFIDNFDSFTFNLVDDLRRRGAEVAVWRNDLPVNDAVALALALPEPRLLVISPGPGHPSEAGSCPAIVQQLLGKIPYFGVCLGHQILIEACGGRVGFAGEVVHGKAAPVTHDGRGIFADLPSPFLAARYHSLAAVGDLPDDLEASATTPGPTGDLVMAVRHRRHPAIGVQFHPESILTPRGGLLIEAVLAWAAQHVVSP